MKITSQDRINVGDVSTEGYLRLDALFNIFQEMAVLHTHRVGFEIKDLLESGKTWVLNRVVVQIAKMPKLEDAIDVYTWSRKIYRFKGLRDYEIFARGESIIKAASLWVYFDFEKGRPIRVPEAFEEKYGTLDEQATGIDIEAVQFQPICRPDLSLPIATRISDYDINGHANNAVILQYIETGLSRLLAGTCTITGIELTFLKEIAFSIKQVNVVLERKDDIYLFEIENDGTIYVRGSVTLE